MVCFDTGSADLWLPGKACRSASCLTHQVFDDAASSTFQVLHYMLCLQQACSTWPATQPSGMHHTAELGSSSSKFAPFGAAIHAVTQ